MSGESPKIAVFVDWQNVYKTAREAFGLTTLPNERGNFSPFRLATHDTDLLPAVEMVARLKGPARIETAGWASHVFVQRLRQVHGVYHHAISGRVFDLVETPVNYARPPGVDASPA
jgi:hypothetical protein